MPFLVQQYAREHLQIQRLQRLYYLDSASRFITHCNPDVSMPIPFKFNSLKKENDF
jgi:hypothetical protein